MELSGIDIDLSKVRLERLSLKFHGSVRKNHVSLVRH